MVRRLLAVLAFALVCAPAASAEIAAPEDVHAFLLRTNETQSRTHTFPRTPAFGWAAVAGADSYEFQLSTSRTFADNAIVYESDEIDQPLVSVPLTLPWITGARYSFHARVRVIDGDEEGAWSAPYGFNVRAGGAPRSLSSASVNPTPGLVRWTPVEGATAYQVVLLYDQGRGASKLVTTTTTAADLREYYAFHNGRDWANVVYWRVRAVREVTGATGNKLPVVSFGPWSGRHRTVEPALGVTSPITLSQSVSRSGAADIVNSNSTGGPGIGPHELTPAFAWSGALTLSPELLGSCPELATAFGITCPLFRVYVFTDADCVNRVHVGDLVGSPAYAPRLNQPLALPGDLEKLGLAPATYLGDGKEGLTFDAGQDPVTASGVSSEEDPAAATGPRTNGLWDNDWPTSRYYWTVVPAVPLIRDKVVEYHEVGFAQDMCAAGQVLPFGKTSAPVTASDADVPYVSGQNGHGRITAATATAKSFFGKVLVAWKPAPGARTYEIQWNKRPSRWSSATSATTAATSTLLDLTPGTWYYRVRGHDPSLAGPTGMTWSDPVEITILPRTFTVQLRGRP
jgi:hypothetical protein